MSTEEKDLETIEDKHGRRSFSKYLIGFGALGIASIIGMKRNGKIRLARMNVTESELAEAQGKCSYGESCGGGGGSCSYGANCSGGGGKCSYGQSCGGGGGKCSYGADCAGK